MTKDLNWTAAQIAVQAHNIGGISAGLWPQLESIILSAPLLTRRQQLTLAMLGHIRLHEELEKHRATLESNSAARLSFCVDILEETRVMLSTEGQIPQLAQWLDLIADGNRAAFEASNSRRPDYLN